MANKKKTKKRQKEVLKRDNGRVSTWSVANQKHQQAFSSFSSSSSSSSSLYLFLAAAHVFNRALPLPQLCFFGRRRELLPSFLVAPDLMAVGATLTRPSPQK